MTPADTKPCTEHATPADTPAQTPRETKKDIASKSKSAERRYRKERVSARHVPKVKITVKENEESMMSKASKSSTTYKRQNVLGTSRGQNQESNSRYKDISPIR